MGRVFSCYALCSKVLVACTPVPLRWYHSSHAILSLPTICSNSLFPRSPQPSTHAISSYPFFRAIYPALRLISSRRLFTVSLRSISLPGLFTSSHRPSKHAVSSEGNSKVRAEINARSISTTRQDDSSEVSSEACSKVCAEISARS